MNWYESLRAIIGTLLLVNIGCSDPPRYKSADIVVAEVRFQPVQSTPTVEAQCAKQQKLLTQQNVNLDKISKELKVAIKKLKKRQGGKKPATSRP